MTIDLEVCQLRWYIVRTRGGQEHLARSAIKAEGIEVYLPLYTEIGRNGEARAKPLFPGYVFAHLGLGIPGWSRVFSARGVQEVLGNGGRPSPLADRIIEEIKWRESEGFVEMGLARSVLGHEPGDAVTLRVGPFTHLPAVFLERIDSKRCKLLLRLLGDSTRVATAELAHVEARASADAI